jgi:hypothetical protein
MDEIIKSFLSSLGATGVALAVGWWLLQRYLERRLAAHFVAVETLLRGKAETAAGLRRKRLEQTAELLPKLSQVGSECRQALRQMKEGYTRGDLDEFLKRRETYVDLLYAASLLLTAEAYQAPHLLKAKFDQAAILLGEPAQGPEPLKAPRGMGRLLSDLDELHEAMLAALRKEYQLLERFTGGAGT